MSFLTKIFFVIFCTSSYGSYTPSITTNFAIVGMEISENDSTLEQTDDTVAADEDDIAESASSSIVSVEVIYEKPFSRQYSYFYKGIAPLITSEGSSLFAGHIGINWYLSDISSQYSIELNGSEVKLRPKARYYIGASTGFGYTIYNTVSAKLSDVFLDIGVHGGGAYQFSKDWAARGELNIGRGTGVTTTNINTKITIGLSWYI